MSAGNTNAIVAKELSDAMARCKQQGVDEQSLRTGLLTITIANFVNRIGMGNCVALFEALPEQITSGIFDRYIDPNTNTPRTYPRTNPASQPLYYQQQPQPVPQQTPQPGYTPPPVQSAYPHQDPSSLPYQNAGLPQNFVPPYPQGYAQVTSPPPSTDQYASRRRITE